MRFLRVVLSVLVGFGVATILLMGIGLLSPMEPSTAGVIHLVAWGAATFGLLKLWPKPNNHDPVGSVNSVSELRTTPILKSSPPVDGAPEGGSDPRLDQGAPTSQADPGDRHEEPVSASPNQPSAGAEPSHWRRAVVIPTVVAALVAVAATAYALGRAEGEIAALATTTTQSVTTTTEAHISANMESLPAPARVWCWRDRDTIAQWASAVEILGFWEFPTGLLDRYRENGGSINADRMSEQWELWEASGADFDRQAAEACLAAFQGRDGAS